MFTTGQFSKIAQVSKRLLHHYDEVDLFKPQRVDPVGGTRYYDAEQLPLLFQILALKDLGVPLERIRSLVGGGLAREEIHEMLVVQRARIEANLEQEQIRLQAVESRLRSFEAAEDTIDDLIVKSVPEQLAVTTRRHYTHMPDAFALIGRLAAEGPGILGARMGPVVAMNHCDGYEMDDVDGEIGCIVREPVEDSVRLSTGEVLEPTVLASHGVVVSAVRRLAVEDTYRSFAALGLWMERTGHVMVGPSREVFLEPPSAEGVAVIETQFPVRPAEEAARVSEGTR
ncbi:MAG: helix-turn-helix domain-containing protein [Planctomycetota bacterium]